MLSEFRHALRALIRERSFSVPCIASLALAIGLATVVFSAFNSVLLRPLNLPAPDTLALLWSVDRNGEDRGVVSFADFEDWRKNTHAFEAAAAYTSFYRPVLTDEGPPERLTSLRVSHEYFAVLQAKPALGRFFAADEDWDGRDDEVVLSDGLWRERFHANPGVIGTKIVLNGRPELVVGVARADLKLLPRSLGGDPPQIYRPVGEARGEGSRDGRHLQTIVRLRSGVSLARAQAELNVLCRQMERAHPDTDAHLAVRVVSLKADVTRNLRGGLLGLQVSVLALLLIACANIANLLLVRSTARQRELAIRTALGAGTGRIARLLFTESLTLSCAGGAAGLAVAWWGSKLLELAGSSVFPDANGFPFDARVVGFSVAVSIATGLLFGTAPVWQMVSARIEELLRDGGRNVAGSRKQILRDGLAAGQIAIALVLLISAGLLIRSFVRLRSANPGFEPRGILTAGLNLPDARYKTGTSRVQFFDGLMNRLSKIPGVSRAALVTLPLSGDFDRTLIEIQGKVVAAGDRESPDRYVVTPGYFAAVKIPLLAGRLLDNRDDASHKYVAVISWTAARLLFRGESPIGKRIRAGSAGDEPADKWPWREIVGVVGDVEQMQLGAPPSPQVYMPYAQYPDSYVTLIVRTSGDPAALAGPVRRAVLTGDPEEPVYDVIPFESLVAGTVAARRFSIWVLGAFALGALTLAAIGIYSVISYSVARRRQEFGIRMALGARPADVSREAVFSGAPAIFWGTLFGFCGALAVEKLLSAFLFEVRFLDPMSFAGAPLAMAAIAFAACYLPARRAGKIEPMEALKYE